MTKILKLFVFMLVALNVQLAFAQDGETWNCSNSYNLPGRDVALTIFPAPLDCAEPDPVGCVAPGFTSSLTSVSLSNVNIHYFDPAGSTGFCPSWYDLDIIVNGNIVAANLCAAAVAAYNINQHAPVTSLALRINDNDAFGDNVYVEFTVNRTYTCAAAPAQGACVLVCSGDQNVTLPGGECAYQVPNLVTMAGLCEPVLVPGPLVSGFRTSPFNIPTYNAYAGACPDVSMILNTPLVTTTATDMTLRSSDPSNAGIYIGTLVYSDPMPFAGTLSFKWNYTTADTDAFWDPFGYQVNGGCNLPLQVELMNGFGVTSGNGTVTIPVNAGDIISWGTYTQDYGGGAATITISNLSLQGASVLNPWTINHVSGPEAGDLLTAGSYTLCYELVNPDGDAVEDCCFDINVTGFPNPSGSLVCNDHVNISADEDCEVTLNADMFLEGNSYACYDSYQINIWPFNSKPNAINNIAQNEAFYLPCGEHTYEIVDPATGNRCWGTFLVEDKIAPVVTCNCQDIDIPTPVTSFGGSLDATDPVFDRCGFTGYNTWYYDVYQFTVSVSGSYTFNAANSNGDTYAYINGGSFDPANPCVGLLAQNDDTAGGLDPLITINLTAGTTYYYIFTTWSPFAGATGAYNVAISGPGVVQTIVNPSEDPACQFACYELPVVQGETVGM
ncbi:MAG TPA: PPC domain-containing protein, partial [Saprospiraceae bacterium]|nr:PPC domain-containing protein [Saprospiraceae bacterium]HMT70215.1 PPC domain-containing protein [Saprospiraceae bacterium]